MRWALGGESRRGSRLATRNTPERAQVSYYLWVSGRVQRAEKAVLNANYSPILFKKKTFGGMGAPTVNNGQTGTLGYGSYISPLPMLQSPQSRVESEYCRASRAFWTNGAARPLESSEVVRQEAVKRKFGGA